MFDTEKFIKLVHSRPCLWDVSHGDYPIRYVKSLAWEDVGREMYSDWDKIGKNERLLRGWSAFLNAICRAMLVWNRANACCSSSARRMPMLSSCDEEAREHFMASSRSPV